MQRVASLIFSADKVARNFGYVDATSNSTLPVAIVSSVAVVATGGTVAEPERSRFAVARVVLIPAPQTHN